jgi:hypothetical protein
MSARLVSTIGTRAPTTTPAVLALACMQHQHAFCGFLPDTERVVEQVDLGAGDCHRVGHHRVMITGLQLRSWFSPVIRPMVFISSGLNPDLNRIGAVARLERCGKLTCDRSLS